MDTKTTTESDYDKPVAYDGNGQPLYAHPSDRPQAVYLERPFESSEPVMDSVIKLKHERSKQAYPNLNLSDGEYVVVAVKRHPIGLIMPLVAGLFLVMLSLIILFNYDSVAKLMQISNFSIGLYQLIIPISLFMILIIIAMYVVYYVYTSNQFFLTNESVIQEIQNSLFSKREQTISLLDIEDASYTQDNLVNFMFNYGSIMLSTKGDETAYRFSYVSNPKSYITILNNAIEAFKDGRPVAEG